MFIVTKWLVTAKKDPPMEAAGFTAQMIILNHPGQISAGYAPVLDCHTAHNCLQVCWAEGEDWPSFWEKAEDGPNSWNLVLLPSLIWFLESSCVSRPSLTILSLAILLCVTWEMVTVGVIKAVDKKAAGAANVTKSAQKAQVQWVLSPIPATPVLIIGGRTVSELFVLIGHLSLIVKDWLIITMHLPSEGKEIVLWTIWFVCGSLLVFKISTF